MKFKKDGKVFEDIVAALVAFCPIKCRKCDLGQFPDCGRWSERSPAEAARLMGYEVVEDEDSNKVNQEIQQEEEPMKKDKPRICEVLGVEPVEYFWIEQDNRKWCVDEKGEKIISSNGETMPGEYLCSIINMPKLIIRNPRFTEEEVAVAEAIEKIYQTGLIGILEREYGNGLWVCFDGKRFPIPSELFPSILPDQSIELSDIVGGEAE